MLSLHLNSFVYIEIIALLALLSHSSLICSVYVCIYLG